MRAWEFIREFNELNKAPAKYPSIETYGYEQLQEDDEDNIPLYSPDDAEFLHRELGEPPSTKDAGALYKYTSGSETLNSALHKQYRGEKLDSFDADDIKQHKELDQVLARTVLPGPITVYSGLPESPWRAWDLYKADKSAPIRLHLPAYTSTSTSFRIACGFSKFDYGIPEDTTLRNPKAAKEKEKENPYENLSVKNVLCIEVPKGYPSRSVKKTSNFQFEDEILLPRGLDIEVDPHPTYVHYNWVPHLVWYAKVIGHNPIEIEDRAK